MVQFALMPAAQPLEEIIRRSCLPLRDCMLTVTDANGEAAFLYFKDGELIEANYAALWGKDALVQIVTWTIEGEAVAPLPLGIKRSLWDRLDYLLNPGLIPTASGRLPALPVFHTARAGSRSPFDRFKALPDLMKLTHLEPDKATVIFEQAGEGAEPENTEWLTEFAASVKVIGDTLGFGPCEKFTVETDRYQIVSLRHEDGFIAMLRKREISGEDLESAVNTLLDGGE